MAFETHTSHPVLSYLVLPKAPLGAWMVMKKPPMSYLTANLRQYSPTPALLPTCSDDQLSSTLCSSLKAGAAGYNCTCCCTAAATAATAEADMGFVHHALCVGNTATSTSHFREHPDQPAKISTAAAAVTATITLQYDVPSRPPEIVFRLRLVFT